MLKAAAFLQHIADVVQRGEEAPASKEEEKKAEKEKEEEEERRISREASVVGTDTCA